MKYGHITAVAIEAIKELNADVKAKDAEIAALTARLAKIEGLVARLARDRTTETPEPVQ